MRWDFNYFVQATALIAKKCSKSSASGGRTPDLCPWTQVGLPTPSTHASPYMAIALLRAFHRRWRDL